MPSVTWRYTALAAMVSAVSGYAVLGELPTRTLMPFQTIGIGYPAKEALQTEAPSLELVKRHLAKRAVTNTCSEWTIPDGLGYTPICDFSETCLFTSATDGYLYEGCGQTSIAYNWITHCYDYNVKTGLPPVSNTYCPESAPYCGYFMFVYDANNTFYNFGCSTTSYASTAYLVANSTTDLAAGGTSKITEAPTVTVTKAPDTSTTAPPQGLNTPASSTVEGSGNTNLPVINPTKKKKKTPIGPIVGGVVGGIIVLAAVAAIVWFCFRKRRQDKLKNQTLANSNQAVAEAATAAAFHNHTANQNHIPEMGGDPKAPTVFPSGVGYTQQHQQNQQGAFVATNEKTHQEYYQPPVAGYNNELADTNSSQSPPPVYANANLNPNVQNQNIPNTPPAPNSPPLSTYTELDSAANNTGRTSVPPVSPMGTQVQSPAISELGSTNPVSELGSGQREFTAYNPPMPEMSATAPQVQRRQVQTGVDMSGAPINESFNPHEMP